MALVFGFVGFLSMVGGIFVLVAAISAVHEILATTLVLGGLMVLILAMILAGIDRLNAIATRMEHQASKQLAASEQARDAATKSATVLGSLAKSRSAAR